MTQPGEGKVEEWHPTDYGFTDGKHQHHCMVTPDQQTCDYLNSDHKLAQVAGEMAAALGASFCRACDNRIGWNDTGYENWLAVHRVCSSCKSARAALAHYESLTGESGNG